TAEPSRTASRAFATEAHCACGADRSSRRSGLGLEQPADRLRGQSADAQPVLDARAVDLELGRLGVGIVGAELLEEATIARVAGIGRHDAVKGVLLGAGASQPDLDGHVN